MYCLTIFPSPRPFSGATQVYFGKSVTGGGQIVRRRGASQSSRRTHSSRHHHQSDTRATHSSYLDFPALFSQSCSTPGSYLCSDRYFCNTSISSSLVERFPEVFGFMQGVKASSTCTWNPFPLGIQVTNWDAPNKAIPTFVSTFSGAVIPNGYCALVPSVDSYGWYAPSTCQDAATSAAGLTGYFENDLGSCSSNSGCYCWGPGQLAGNNAGCVGDSISANDITMNFNIQQQNAYFYGQVCE